MHGFQIGQALFHDYFDTLSVTLFVSLYVAGGFLCFDIQPNAIIECQGKLLELEGVGILEGVTKEKVQLFDYKDFPRECTAFVFKVLKK